MKTLTIRNIIRWCLAFLCFGLVGIKISNAQIIGSSGCNFGYASAIMSLTVGAELATGNLYQKVSGVYESYWGERSSSAYAQELNISNPFGSIMVVGEGDPNSGTPVSLSDTASSSHALFWNIFHFDAFSAPPEDFNYTINSVSVTGHAIGGGVLNFDLLIGGAPIGNGVNLGNSFSGYVDYRDYTGDIYYNNNMIEFRPYDNGTNVMEFQIDSLNVDITAYINGGTEYYNLCTGAITPAPEVSTSLLGSIGALVIVTRRRRA